jgi:hypothetical protein
MLACAGDLYCDGGICVAPPGEGEACDWRCAAGFECSESDVCVASEPLLCGPLFFQ